MWIEPLIYVLDPAPRDPDISRIMSRSALVSNFSQEAGQQQGALYWALKGVPGALKTAAAAAKACNSYYGKDRAPTYAIAIAPDKFDAGNSLIDAVASHSHFTKDFENIVRLTP
jgi:hypothetical protein